APADSGHAAAAPPSAATNSRRRRQSLICPSCRRGAPSRQDSTAEGCGPKTGAFPGPGPAGKWAGDIRPPTSVILSCGCQKRCQRTVHLLGKMLAFSKLIGELAYRPTPARVLVCD